MPDADHNDNRSKKKNAIKYFIKWCSRNEKNLVLIDCSAENMHVNII